VPTLLALALAGPGQEAGSVAMSRVRGEAFVLPFEWKHGIPRGVGEMTVRRYEEIARLESPGLVCDADAAAALEGLAGGVRVQKVTPSARWVGVYAARAGGAAPAREFFPEYGPSPVYRKRGRPA
jgi:hypothetical protein